MTSAETKRWLEKRGCTFGARKGSHLKVYPGDKQTVLPMHAKKELKKGLQNAIKKSPPAEMRKTMELPAAGIRKVDLARRLQCSPSQVDRLLDIAHHSKLEQMEAAFAAIGKRLAIEILDAA